MATWQYTLHLIPRAHLLDRLGALPDKMSRGLMNERSWWHGFTLEPGYERMLGLILPERPAWQPQMRTWGTDDGDRIDILLDEGAIDEFAARVDARHAGSSDFLTQLIRFAARFDLVFVTEELNVREPHLDQLRLDLARSGANEFVKDPEGFLRRQRARGLTLED